MLKKSMKIMDDKSYRSVSAASMHSPFDVIAEKNGRTIILKFASNIDSITERDGIALSKLGFFFDAETYVVGYAFKGTKIEDDKIFARHGVDCISADTLSEVISDRSLPHAKKFMKEPRRINGSELKRIRKIAGMSMESLSDSTGVSKDSIYRYEHGFSAITSATLKKLEKALSSKLEDYISTDLHTYSDAFGVAKGEMIFVDLGTGPFEKMCKMRYRFELGNMADKRTMQKRASFYKRLNAEFGDYQFVLGENLCRKNIYGIPVITKEEFDFISDESELSEIAEERAGT